MDVGDLNHLLKQRAIAITTTAATRLLHQNGHEPAHSIKNDHWLAFGDSRVLPFTSVRSRSRHWRRSRATVKPWRWREPWRYGPNGYAPIAVKNASWTGSTRTASARLSLRACRDLGACRRANPGCVFFKPFRTAFAVLAPFFV